MNNPRDRTPEAGQPGASGQPPRYDQEGPDPSADTATFRAFVERKDEPRKTAGAPFRIVTLVAGLVAFVVIALLLLQG